jgi:predicted small integral membrane protein
MPRILNTAVMFLVLVHLLRGEHIWELWGQVGNPKHESVSCPHSRGANAETLK